MDASLDGLVPLGPLKAILDGVPELILLTVLANQLFAGQEISGAVLGGVIGVLAGNKLQRPQDRWDPCGACGVFGDPDRHPQVSLPAWLDANILVSSHLDYSALWWRIRDVSPPRRRSFMGLQSSTSIERFF